MHRGFPRTRAPAPEMHVAEMSAAPHHFVRGDRRIVSAGKQAEHAASRVRGESAGSGKLVRIDQHRPGSDLDAAGEVWIVEFHAHLAAGGLQAIEKVASDARFNVDGPHRKRFVAALGTNSERGKWLR